MKKNEIHSILIIDDDDALTNGMQKLLSRNGFAVHTARNGKFGLDLLERERVDLVITDIFMEEMEGLETIVALRQQFPKMRLIAMSGGSNVVGLDCLDVARTLGANKILRKPIAIQSLLNTIQELDPEAVQCQEN